MNNYTISSNQNLLDSTRDLMSQSLSMHKNIKIDNHLNNDHQIGTSNGLSDFLHAMYGNEKFNPSSHSVESYSNHSGGKKSVDKKVKQIDTYKKVDLEKIAKKNEISLKTRDGKIKTKQQLFDSLKRKKII